MNDPLDDALDARLRAAFAPPSPQQLAATARDVVAAPAPKRRWPWFLVCVAAFLLQAILLWAMPPARGPEGHDGSQLGAMWAAVFQDAETSGFRGTCCDVGQDFGIACEKRFAVKLAFGGSGDVTLHGCYCGLPTGGCVAVLAQTGDGPTGVFIVPRAQDPHPFLPAGSPLHLARRELGPLVLYAVSRTPSASSLEPFRIAP